MSQSCADPQLDVGEALRCVYLSAAAYCNPDNVRTWSCLPCRLANITGFRTLETIYAPKTDTHGYIGLDVRGKRIVVAFMGAAGKVEAKVHSPRHAAAKTCDVVWLMVSLSLTAIYSELLDDRTRELSWNDSKCRPDIGHRVILSTQLMSVNGLRSLPAMYWVWVCPAIYHLLPTFALPLCATLWRGALLI